MDPVGNGIEDVAAELPMFQVLRAAHGELSAVGGFARGEDVPGFILFDDRGIVGPGDVSSQRVDVRILCGGNTRCQREKDERDSGGASLEHCMTPSRVGSMTQLSSRSG